VLWDVRGSENIARYFVTASRDSESRIVGINGLISIGSAQVLSVGSSVHDYARPSARDAAARAYPGDTANCAIYLLRPTKAATRLASTFVIGLAGFFVYATRAQWRAPHPCPFIESAGWRLL